MKKILLTTSICLFSLSTLAGDIEKKYSVQFNLGGGYALDSNKDYKKMGSSGVFGIEVGAKVNNHFRLGLEFDYLPSFSAQSSPEENNLQFTSTNIPAGVSTSNGYTINNKSGSAIQSATTNVKVFPGQRKVVSYVGMINLYYDIDQYDKFKPYFLVGLGISNNKTHNNQGQYSISMPNNLIITSPSGAVYQNGSSGVDSLNGASKTNFAWKLGIGTRYDINNSMAFDFRYQFQYLGQFKTANIPNGQCYRGTLQVNEASVGLVYKF